MHLKVSKAHKDKIGRTEGLKEYFTIVGSAALLAVIEGRLTAQEATDMLQYIKELKLSKDPKRGRKVMQYLKRKGWLSGETQYDLIKTI